jgi:hypothetical protein
VDHCQATFVARPGKKAMFLVHDKATIFGSAHGKLPDFGSGFWM